MRMPQLVHELLPERGAALFEQLGANAQRAARRPVAKSAAAELREHGYELDRGFGQAVARPLAGSTSGRSPVLRQVAEGVLIHESEFCQSNTVVVHGRAGVLLIDPGVHGYEMACLANDLSDSGQTVCAGVSAHS